VVRHPIYAANFGLLLATGLAFSRLGPLLLASFAFWIGSVIRVRGEERLLREAFGEEYEAYARRVPALFPRLC
jgi:protein-S-isoprenylcysteine O-methyltransferase Ste14